MKQLRDAGFSLRTLLGMILALTVLSGCALPAHRNAETVSTAGGLDGGERTPGPAIPDPRALGREDAPVVVVEYSDYQCPYCGKFHNLVLPRLKSDYIDTGKVRYFFRDLPLAMHRESVPAAIAAHCAAEQEKFWAMNDALFANQGSLGTGLYGELARRLQLDPGKFADCRERPSSRAKVLQDVRDARRYGLSSTPSFILGRYEQGRIRIHRTASGYADFETFAREVDALLALPR